MSAPGALTSAATPIANSAIKKREQTAEPQEPQNRRTAEPQNRRTAEPQNRRTAEPQNRRTAEPQKVYGILIVWTCPRALVAKRGDVRIREKEGFKCPSF